MQGKVFVQSVVLGWFQQDAYHVCFVLTYKSLEWLEKECALVTCSRTHRNGESGEHNAHSDICNTVNLAPFMIVFIGYAYGNFKAS